MIPERLFLAAVSAILLLATPAVYSAISRAVYPDLASPDKWCDLGDAFRERGDNQKAGYCYRRAAVMGPRDGPVLIRAGNYFMLQDDSTASLPYYSRALELTPNYDGVIFASYRRMEVPASGVLAHGIPEDKRAGQAYFEWLLAHSSTPEDARLAWDWMARHSYTDDRLAGLYAAYLLKSRLYPEAASLWASYTGSRRGDYLRPNRIYNANFQNEPIASPLDWRIDKLDGVEVQRRPGALQIHFNGTENVNFAHIRQSVVVAPGTYRFQADAKATGITTNQGIQFHLYDTDQPARFDVLTDSILGTHESMKIDKIVAIPPPTKLLTLEIVRRPSQKFDNKIEGTVSIHTVRLVPA